MTVLPAVEVNAPTPKPPERASATKVTLDATALRRFQPVFIGDALAGVPGVELVKTGPWASRLSIRGVSGERVLLTVDGVRMSTGRGHGSQAGLVPIDDLVGVEVAPGSAGVVGGSDAVGGIVNLVTRGVLFAPSLQALGSVQARAASPGGTLAPAAQLRLLGPHFGAEVSGGLSTQSALVTPSGPLEPSGSRDEHWRIHLGGRIDGWRADLERSRDDARDIGLPAFGAAATAQGSYPLQSRRADRFDLEWRASARPMVGRLRLTDQRYDTAFEEVTTDSIISPRTRQVIATRNDTAYDDVATDARGALADLRVGTRHSAVLQLEWREETSHGPGSVHTIVRNMGGEVTSDGEIPRTTVAPASRRGVAAAATGRIETPVARIEAGARFDRLHAQAEAVIDTLGDDASPAIDALDEEWSGELGLVRRAGAFEPYGRVATGFRAPNLDERFHDGIVHGGLRIFGNPELSAETSITYELGLRYERPDVGRARVSVYRSDFEDFIEMAYLGQLYLIPRFQYVNVAEARVEGVELQMETRRGRFDLGITAAAPHGIDLETGARLPSAGTRRTTFDVQAHLPAPNPRVADWRAAVRARWSDAVPAEAALAGDSESSSTTSFARSASWAVDVETRARLGTTELALSIRNLFDHAYREPLSYIEEPGRTFGISVRHDFALLSP